MNQSANDMIGSSPGSTVRAGVIYGVAAYSWWGLVPIYFKAVVSVPAMQILAHRIVWSVVLLAGLILVQNRWRAVVTALRDRRTAATLCGTAILIAANWLVFIWAVANDCVLQASLGYFINPLVNVLLGFVFLGERLRRWQSFSVLLAMIGVTYLTVTYGEFPWIAFVLAFSFGFYGLLRKTASADSVSGLAVETTLLAPLAVAYLCYLAVEGSGSLGTVSRGMDGLLLAAGVVTAVPLVWFAKAARRLRLATLGFLQYIAPMGHFLLAVVLYDEPFTQSHLISFMCIWVALLVYSMDTARAARGQA